MLVPAFSEASIDDYQPTTERAFTIATEGRAEPGHELRIKYPQFNLNGRYPKPVSRHAENMAPNNGALSRSHDGSHNNPNHALEITSGQKMVSAMSGSLLTALLGKYPALPRPAEDKL